MFPDKLFIDLTQAHIDQNGLVSRNSYNRCGECPVALAVRDAFLRHDPRSLDNLKVRACQAGIGVYPQGLIPTAVVYYDVPPSVAAFITAADMKWSKAITEGIALVPMTFEINKTEDHSDQVSVAPVAVSEAPAAKKKKPLIGNWGVKGLRKKVGHA